MYRAEKWFVFQCNAIHLSLGMSFASSYSRKFFLFQPVYLPSNLLKIPGNNYVWDILCKVLAFETPLTLKSFNDHSRALAKRLNIFIQHRVCQTIEHVINVGWLNGPVHSVRWRNHCSQGNKQCLTKHSTKRVHRTIFAYCCWFFYILWFIWFLKHVFIEVIATSAY